MLLAAIGCERASDSVGGDERAGLEEAPALLGDDRSVDHAVARHRPAAELLGNQHGEPTQLRGLAPVVGPRVGVLVGELADLRERARGLDEARGRVAHQLLITAQVEVHVSPSCRKRTLRQPLRSGAP